MAKNKIKQNIKLRGIKQNHLGWMHGQSFKPITYKTKHQI
jgi:hypothetical protein